MQEWIGRLGKKFFPKKYNHIVPKKLDSVLRYLRYAVLALVVYQTAATTKLMFQSIDPYYALFNFFTNEVAVTAYIVLGFVVLLSLIIERPWCKYLCPYGALLGLFNSIRIFKIRRNKETCISCKKCDKVCPMNIEVSGKEIIRNNQCISCHKCTSEVTCPVNDTVEVTAGKNKKPIIIKPVFIVLTIFIIGIIAANLTGLWNIRNNNGGPGKGKGHASGTYEYQAQNEGGKN